MADDVTSPRIFLATQVYLPWSCDVTSVIIKLRGDGTTRLSATRFEFCFSHLTLGFGFPSVSHWNEAVPDSFTTVDIGGATIEGAEIDLPGSPLGPCGPLGPGGPWIPWGPRFPLVPWGPVGPGGPCLPGEPLGPGLPRLPVILLGHWTVQAWVLIASRAKLLMTSWSIVSLAFVSVFVVSTLRL